MSDLPSGKYVVVTAITPTPANAFATDHEADIREVEALAREAGVRSAVSNHVMKGGAGTIDLVRMVAEASEHPVYFRFSYDFDQSLEAKIESIATKVYGADGIDTAASAASALRSYKARGFGRLPVVIAKTHLSISHDPKLSGAPTDWRLPIREVRLAAGAGYVYAIAGSMRTMPALGASPAAERIDIDESCNILGLF